MLKTIDLMRPCITVILLLTLNGLASASFARPQTGERKIRVLIVDGFSNHDWPQTTALLRGILESTKGFAVSISTAPQETDTALWSAWRPRFADYDVVIQTCNDNAHNGLLEGVSHEPQWPEAVKSDFVDFVRNGGGVYVFHAAENAFVGWKEYEQMVGLCWRGSDYGTAIRVNEDGTLARIPPGNPPGEPGSTGHDKRGDVLVTRLSDDPIHSGMPHAWLTPDLEVYYYARGPAENLQVLAYARDSKPGQGWLWPVEWTTCYGKGRIYVSTYGHVWPGDVQPAGMRCAAVQTIIPRAIQWLAKRPVTIPVPADFPGTKEVSIRARIPSPGENPKPAGL
jgi:type 1 glutamine amidotransferase